MTAVQGLAIGTRIKVPFVFDYAVHLRFLIALPILILAESPVDSRWQTIILEFLRAGLVDKIERLRYEAVLQKIMRLRDRGLPEIAMLVLAYLAPLFLESTGLSMGGITNWRVPNLNSGELSMAGGFG